MAQPNPPKPSEIDVHCLNVIFYNEPRLSLFQNFEILFFSIGTGIILRNDKNGQFGYANQLSKWNRKVQWDIRDNSEPPQK